MYPESIPSIHVHESIQYNAALAITGVTKGTTRHKIYSELA